MSYSVIKCIVSDKKAVEVLRLLKPYAMEPPVVDPIGEGLTLDQPVTRAKTIGSSAAKIVKDFIKTKRTGAVITATDLKNHVVSSGYSERSYSYPLKVSLDEGVLKKTKTSGEYEVT